MSARTPLARLAARLTAICLLVMAVTACGGPSPAKISGEVKGAGDMNIYFRYYAGGSVNSSVTATRDGKFETTLSVPDPAVVEILDNQNRRLGFLYLRNGDEVTVAIDTSNPYANTVTGNEVNERWAAAMRASADALGSGVADTVNTVVERYVEAHPDDIVGALMAATLYDASQHPGKAAEIIASLADVPGARDVLASLAMLVNPYAGDPERVTAARLRYRPVGLDTVLTLDAGDSPASLIVISDEMSKRRDSIVPRIKEFRKSVPPSRCQVLDLVLFQDTVTLRAVTRPDSADWQQGWIPGGILSSQLEPLAIPSLPYCILLDNKGRQIYRGRSIMEAAGHM